MARLKVKYTEEVAPALFKKFGYKSTMQIPKIDGNYALGIKEQLIFPEIEYDKIDKIRGMDIVICTTAQTDEEARELLTLVGAPFER